MSARVPARCCYGFFLPSCTTEHQRAYHVRVAIKRLLNTTDLALREDYRKDIAVLQLLIPLRWRDLPPNVRATLSEATRKWLLKDRRNVLWGCRYLDRPIGKCTIHSQRPHMCRAYPDNKGSDYPSEERHLCNNHCSSTHCTFHPEHA